MASYSKLPVELRVEILEKIPDSEWQSFHALRRSDSALFAACNSDGTQRFHPLDSLRSGRFSAAQHLTPLEVSKQLLRYGGNIFVLQLARSCSIHVPNSALKDYFQICSQRLHPTPPTTEPSLFSTALWNQLVSKSIEAFSNPQFVCSASVTKEQERTLRNARIAGNPSMTLNGSPSLRISRQFLVEIHRRMKRAARPQRLRVLAMRDPKRGSTYRYSRGRWGRDEQLGHYRVLDGIDNEMYGLLGELTSPYIEEVICADLEILLQNLLYWSDIRVDPIPGRNDIAIRNWKNMRSVESCITAVVKGVIAKLWGKEDDREALKELADAGQIDWIQIVAHHIATFHQFCNTLNGKIQAGSFGGTVPF